MLVAIISLSQAEYLKPFKIPLKRKSSVKTKEVSNIRSSVLIG